MERFHLWFEKIQSKKWLIILVIAVLVVAGIICVVIGHKGEDSGDDVNFPNTETEVTRKTIVSSITGSSVVMPKDQYTITSLLSGDVISANFEQGDVVKKGDILYKIDSSDAESSIQSANLSVQRSQNNYNDALGAREDLGIVSDVSGVIKKLYIKKGDSVNAGAQIADIYDDSVMLLTVPFNEDDAINIFAGDVAMVTITDTGEALSGTVHEVRASSHVKDGNMVVRDVIIAVENPGAIMAADSALADIGEFTCNDSGTFEYITEKTITAKAAGDVDKIYYNEGDIIEVGALIASLVSETVEKNIRSNQISLNEANLSRNNARKKLEDYTIKAPISGTVVEKNVKSGDKLDNGNSTMAMAVIYDMSSLEIELSVDELDIKNVEVGQSVIISSDAIEGKRYNGEVVNVSVNGTSEGGVTTYPVKIEILDFDEELLPGMNVDVEIITSKAENVLCVPLNAVNRGNIVYVKGEKNDDKDSAPEGFKSVRVETGVSDDDMIEIVSGLSKGDIVYSLPITDISENNRQITFPGGGMPGGGMPGGGMPGGGVSGGGMTGGGVPNGGMR